jgi:hypothetical protein
MMWRMLCLLTLLLRLAAAIVKSRQNLFLENLALSPASGADSKSQPAPVELSGSCLLGMALPRLELMEDSASARAARYRHPLASGGFSSLLAIEESS